MLARSRDEAHLRLVFGRTNHHEAGRQRLDLAKVFNPRMAAASVHAPIWSPLAGGLGQRQAGSLQGSERRGVAGQAKNLAGQEPGKAARAGLSRGKPVKGRGLGPAPLRGRARRSPTGKGRAAGRERKPDAGASAGDKSPALVPNGARWRGARHRAPSMAPRKQRLKVHRKPGKQGLSTRR